MSYLLAKLVITFIFTVTYLEVSGFMAIIAQNVTFFNRCFLRILGKSQSTQKWDCFFSNHNRGVIYIGVTRHVLDSSLSPEETRY